MSPRPLVITEDTALLDEALRLTALAGLEAEVAAGPVRAQWRAAPLVLLGADRVVAAAVLPRHPGVVLLTRAADMETYASGVRLGALDVVELPAGEGRLVELLAGSRAAPAEPAGPPGAVWSVLSGCGGAGASVLAASLATVAAPFGQTLLVEADPLGGGVDLLLGAERLGGLRWPDLSTAGTGPLPPTALRDALPRAHGVTILSAGRPPSPSLDVPSAVAVGAVLEAGRRFARLTVADVSRAVGPAAEAALDDSQRALLVVPDEVRAIAAAARTAAWARQRCADLELVVRLGVGGLPAATVAATLGLPLAGELAPEPGLGASLERGALPTRRSRGPLARLCADLLADLSGSRS
jgi:secretion/DNA translocation related CpaE-like protein